MALLEVITAIYALYGSDDDDDHADAAAMLESMEAEANSEKQLQARIFSLCTDALKRPWSNNTAKPISAVMLTTILQTAHAHCADQVCLACMARTGARRIGQARNLPETHLT